MSEKIEKPYAVEGKPECPRCKEVITQAQDVVPGSSNVFRKGKIIVCAKCALISRVGNSKLIPMSKNDVMALPHNTQVMLWATCQKVAQAATANN